MRFAARLVLICLSLCAGQTTEVTEMTTEMTEVTTENVQDGVLASAIEVLREIEALEGERVPFVPFSVDEVLAIMREKGVDLLDLLNKAEIEEHVEHSNNNNNNNNNNAVDFDNDSFLTEMEFELGVHLITGRTQTLSNLSGTSNLILNMIFSNYGMGSMPTPPPMPVFIEESSTRWGSWKNWSSCTATCGGGSRKRYRQCIKPKKTDPNCVGSQRQISNCQTQDCPFQNQWSKWQTWGKCTKTCGVGQQIRRRYCKGQSCIGDTVQIQKCNQNSCHSSASYWLEWSSWSQCSRTCNGGFKARIRQCHNGTNCSGDKSQHTTCNASPCESRTNLIWQEWSKCSATCGTGIRKRTRPCEYTAAKCRRYKLEETEQCDTGTPCGYWSSWRGWGACTVSCGLGVKARIRKCIDGVPEKGGCLGSYEDTEGCNSQTCPAWTQWQPWSMCTATCGGGLQRRARYCRNGKAGTDCPGKASEERSCQTDKCPRWTNWSTWTECTKTCGGGVKRITRECLYGNVGQRGCFGQSSLTYACNTLDCARWGKWGEFTKCSATCGGGRMHRLRECIGGVPGIECLGSHQDIQACATEGCPYWSNWTPWAPCSNTCDRGFTFSQRYCSKPGGCQGENERTAICDTQNPCEWWMDWSSYSSCSATCGGGQKQRSRVCSGGHGMCGSGRSTERVTCNEEECPSLTAWTQWSDCSVTCGYGSRTRSRSCLSPDGVPAKCYAALNSEQGCYRRDCPVRPPPTRPPTTSRTTPRTTPRPTTKRPAMTSTTTFFSTTLDGSMKEVIDEIDKVKATADPERLREECIVLNVNGDCLDHLEWDKDDQIVDIGNCNLPAFIVTQNDKVSGFAELVTDSKVRYKCMDSWRIRGNKNMECRCRGNKCRPRPKQIPRCIPEQKGPAGDGGVSARPISGPRPSSDQKSVSNDYYYSARVNTTAAYPYYG